MVKQLTTSLFVILLIVWCSLVKAETTSYDGFVSFYTGSTGWIDKASADEQANIGSILLMQSGIKNKIYASDADGANLADWMQRATGNGQLDVLVLYGSCPSEIYSNQQPDGSIAERFIESTDGDTIINHADYMFYVGWESSTDPSSGESSGNDIWNQSQGLQNIMDIPSITMWPSENSDGGIDQCIVTPLGQEISPTLGLLEDVFTYRPFHVNEIAGSSWQVEAVLAQSLDGSLADPIILRDGNRGRLISCFQIENPTEPIGVIGADIITWLYRNNQAAWVGTPTHSYTRGFELALETGINMISMPLNVKRIQKDSSWMAISESAGTMAGGLKLQNGDIFRMSGNVPAIPIATGVDVGLYSSSPSTEYIPPEQFDYDISSMTIYELPANPSASGNLNGVTDANGDEIWRGLFAHDTVDELFIRVMVDVNGQVSLAKDLLSSGQLVDPIDVSGVDLSEITVYTPPEQFDYDAGADRGTGTGTDILQLDDKGRVNIYQGTRDYVFNEQTTRFFAHERGQEILVPVKPIWIDLEGESLTARQLASSMNPSWVIRFDQSDGRFKAYIPQASTEGMNFKLESGKGYLVNVTEAKMVNLEGMPWGTPIFNEDSSPADSDDEQAEGPPPQTLAAPSIQETGPWAFVVSGHISGVVTEQTKIVVTNLRTGTSTPSTISFGKSTTTNINQPNYTAVFVDPNRKSLVNSGDVYQVTIIDPSIDPIQYQFRVESTHLSAAHLTANTRLSSQVPEITQLGQNYPNPFNPETWIPYQLHRPAAVSVTIYNVAGSMVRQISVGFRPAGSYQSIGRAIYWDGRTDYGETVASGIYFYTLQAEEFTATRRLVILK